jgi:centromere protein J
MKRQYEELMTRN